MPHLRAWLRDRRGTYVDPATHKRMPERRRAWRRAGPGQILLYVIVMAAIVIGFYRFQETADTANKHNAALCTLRTDRERDVVKDTAQIRQTEDFLSEHPNGIPGISAATIKRGLVSQRADRRGHLSTVKALRPLEC